MSDEQPKGKSNGELVTQPHGGALKRGGRNVGAGRKPNQFRAKLRTNIEVMRGDLYTAFRSKKTRLADKIRIFEVFCKYGYGDKLEVTGADGEPLMPPSAVQVVLVKVDTQNGNRG
jgi:hypothetical protein